MNRSSPLGVGLEIGLLLEKRNGTLQLLRTGRDI